MAGLEEFRKMAMAFPGVTEEPHFEKISFRVRKRIFATLDPGTATACIKLTEVQQSVFCGIDESLIYPVPNKWGKHGWTLLQIDRAEDELIQDALTTSYENVVKPQK